jgi:hypothetical protein
MMPLTKVTDMDLQTRAGRPSSHQARLPAEQMEKGPARRPHQSFCTRGSRAHGCPLAGLSRAPLRGPGGPEGSGRDNGGVARIVSKSEAGHGPDLKGMTAPCANRRPSEWLRPLEEVLAHDCISGAGDAIRFGACGGPGRASRAGLPGAAAVRAQPGPRHPPRQICTAMNAVRRVSRWVAGAAALFAGLSTHGLGLIVLGGLAIFLALLGRGMIRWIIDSGDRSDRVTRMISAWRVGASALAPGPPAASSPATSPDQQLDNQIPAA